MTFHPPRAIEHADGIAHIRPCRLIPADGNEDNPYATSIAALHAPLTTLLPLAGGAALAPDRSRVPRLIATLRAEAPWMDVAIDRIADQTAMSLWAGRPWLAFRPMLLVGPPGAGKTHFARRLAALSGCGEGLLSLAGTSSNAELAGNPRGFRHQQPCFPAMVMQRTGTANPVVIVDEIDKACGGALGDPVAALLGLPPGALPRLEAAAEASLLRLFRNTRSVRRLRRAVETVVAISARHAERTIN